MRIWPGEHAPLGATFDGVGTNFSLFSEVAEKVELCLFDEGGQEVRITLPERTAFNWHGYVPGVGPGQRYGYRVHGPWSPQTGQRFNPAKLLIDPYAKAVEGEVDHSAGRAFPYAPDGDDADLVRDDTDDAAAIPKSVVVDDSFDWQDDDEVRPRIPWHDAVIYEAHVKGFTMRHSGVREDLRGTFAG